MTKTVLMIDQEIVKEGIKLLIEEFGRLHLLQIDNGLRTLLEAELSSDEFLRAVTSLNDCEFLSQHIHGYYKINKKYTGTAVSKARMDKVALLKTRFAQVKLIIRKQLK